MLCVVACWLVAALSVVLGDLRRIKGGGDACNARFDHVGSCRCPLSMNLSLPFFLSLCAGIPSASIRPLTPPLPFFHPRSYCSLRCHALRSAQTLEEALQACWQAPLFHFFCHIHHGSAFRATLCILVPVWDHIWCLQDNRCACLSCCALGPESWFCEAAMKGWVGLRVFDGSWGE